MSTPKTRIVHLHIPKTAGTAIRTAFERQKGKAGLIFPHYDEKLYTDVDADAYDVFSGHIGFATASRLGGRVITVLRDPIDRFVSVYYFWRQLHERGVERNRKTSLAMNYTLDDFVMLKDEPLLTEEFFNRATWQIAIGSSMQHRQRSRDTGITDKQLLELAQRNLSTFSVVGFQEDLSSFNAEVGRLAGIKLEVHQTNVTDSRVAVSDISPTTRRLIHDWVYLDAELIRFARSALGNPRDRNPSSDINIEASRV